MNNDFYFDKFYPFQDRALAVIHSVGTGFYLTGGTAASRGYLHHRFSDDLDFFVNDDEHFGLWAERIIKAVTEGQDWRCKVFMKEERFVRFTLDQEEISLKLEFVNDVPARVGEVTIHPVLGRLDTAANILANKVTAAIDRAAPKDLADIWGFCCKMDLSLQDAITGAQGKAIGIFPADLARVLCSASRADWEAVRWMDAPPPDVFLSQLNELGEKLLLL
ncbi:MAG: hypothetical protein FD146_40 [Anaerolineaceae bacterium]|nr:MAG: hypothetical protein FD146_40 [Anaerolineaceae bacterium]